MADSKHRKWVQLGLTVPQTGAFDELICLKQRDCKPRSPRAVFIRCNELIKDSILSGAGRRALEQQAKACWEKEKGRADRKTPHR